MKPLFDRTVGFYSCTVPAFEQYVLASLLDNGDFERHINRIRRAERKKGRGGGSGRSGETSGEIK